MKAAVIVEGGDRHYGLPPTTMTRRVALLQFFHCDPLLDIDEVRLDPEPLENCQCSHERAAIGRSTLTVFPSRSFRLLMVFGRRPASPHCRACHIGELVLDVVGEALLLEVVERVARTMPRSTPFGKRMSATLCTEPRPMIADAQITAVVDHGSEVGTELHIVPPIVP